MGGRRKEKTLDMKEKGVALWTTNGSTSARNLRKSDLGAVIFGCKNHTINECHVKLLFGLPAPHFAYVEKVRPGMPLFLFNYSDRKLHGIYEATSAGKINIDLHGWTDDSENYTPYPAQVRIKVRTRCSPLSEDEFKPIIAENYYERRLFWFELDQAQTHRLISLFTSCTHPLNMPMRHKTVFPVSDGGQAASSKAFASLDNADVAWGGSYAAIVSGKASFIPEKKPIGCTERKWSSLFESPITSEKTTLTKDDELSSSKIPLQSGEKKLFKDSSEWPNVKHDLKKIQPFEAHNSTRGIENYYAKFQLEAFDTSCEQGKYCNISWLDDDVKWERPSDVEIPAIHALCEAPTGSDKRHDGNFPCSDGSDSDASSECSYFSAIEGMSSTDVQALVIKLMEEVEALKVSHQVLQRELVDSKATILLLKSQYHTLESRVLPSIEDVEEAMANSFNESR